MKKVIVVIMLLIMMFAICSCSNEILQKDDFAMYEWISPDGVHYWRYETGKRFGIVPRYGSDGQLVIDGGVTDGR